MLDVLNLAYGYIVADEMLQALTVTVPLSAPQRMPH